VLNDPFDRGFERYGDVTQTITHVFRVPDKRGVVFCFDVLLLERVQDISP
jgi:hypothetical protein